MNRNIAIALGVLMWLMLAASPTFAHVTVSTDNPEPGGFAVYTVRVPNESETASTIRIEVEIPAGLEASRYEPNGDWSMSLSEGAFVIEGGAIAPGEFGEFRFQARNPEDGGDLSFAAIQMYDDGEVVNWTGEPESDQPASVVAIRVAEEGDGAAGTDVLTVIALVLGALGTLFGGVALLRRPA